MSAHPVALLVEELRRRGVEWKAHDGRVRFRPKSAVRPEEVEQLIRHREVVLALLRGGCCVDPAPVPTDKTDRSTDPFVLSVLSAFPGARLEPGRVLSTVPFDVDPKLGACYACGSLRWWRGTSRRRLPDGGPWICPRCHPPGLPANEVEFVEVVGG